ncbi:hypothetical protein ABW19_dt0200660 [Dactylella cylindrospora]|nr:hypothetical protein ABW19_dt0200660 [Dactylella cylindrospora]
MRTNFRGSAALKLSTPLWIQGAFSFIALLLLGLQPAAGQVTETTTVFDTLFIEEFLYVTATVASCPCENSTQLEEATPSTSSFTISSGTVVAISLAFAAGGDYSLQVGADNQLVLGDASAEPVAVLLSDGRIISQDDPTENFYIVPGSSSGVLPVYLGVTPAGGLDMSFQEGTAHRGRNLFWGFSHPLKRDGGIVMAVDSGNGPQTLGWAACSSGGGQEPAPGDGVQLYDPGDAVLPASCFAGSAVAAAVSPTSSSTTSETTTSSDATTTSEETTSTTSTSDTSTSSDTTTTSTTTTSSSSSTTSSSSSSSSSIVSSSVESSSSSSSSQSSSSSDVPTSSDIPTTSDVPTSPVVPTTAAPTTAASSTGGGSSSHSGSSSGPSSSSSAPSSSSGSSSHSSSHSSSSGGGSGTRRAVGDIRTDIGPRRWT